MTPFLKAAFAGLVLGVSLSLAGAVCAQSPAMADPPAVDHHMHIFSPEGSWVLELICKALGPGGCPPQRSIAPATGADVVAALDQAGIGQGVLLSGGYLFGSPEVADQHLNVAKGTRDENTFIVGEAKAHCGRLVPFISVSPASPKAVDEIRYWGAAGGAAGLKLHLGSAAFDFRDAGEVRMLSAIFKAAGEAHLPIVIHLQTRRKDYGAKDAEIFLRDVYPKAKDVPVTIAHAAGGGGVDDGELAALGVFADAIRTRPHAMNNLYFDLAMVPDLFANEGKIPASPAHLAALEVLMRKIGLNHFLLGSDYVVGLDLKGYYINQKAALALSEADWRTLAGNKAPYVDRAIAQLCRVSH